MYITRFRITSSSFPKMILFKIKFRFRIILITEFLSKISIRVALERLPTGSTEIDRTHFQIEMDSFPKLSISYSFLIDNVYYSFPNYF